MNPKPILTVFFLCLVLVPAPAQEAASWAPQILAILQDYQGTLGNEPEGTPLKETASTVVTILQDHRFFYLDRALTGIYDGMSFSREKDGSRFGLAFGEEFLSTYRPGSSPHLTVLAHELWHFRDYLKDRQAFIAQDGDPTERLLYEMDAIHVEADFGRLLKARGAALRSFEQFLLASYEHDYLASAVLYLKSESQGVVFEMIKRERALRAAPFSAAKEVASVVAYGNAILDAYGQDRAATTHRGFSTFIDLVSFRKQVQRFVPFVLNEPTLLWKDVFERYPDLEALYLKIVAIEQEDLQRWTDYRKSVWQRWEADARVPEAAPGKGNP